MFSSRRRKNCRLIVKRGASAESWKGWVGPEENEILKIRPVWLNKEERSKAPRVGCSMPCAENVRMQISFCSANSSQRQRSEVE